MNGLRLLNIEFDAQTWCCVFPLLTSSRLETWLIFTQVMAMLNVVSLKWITPHSCLRKSHILHRTFQFSVVSLSLEEL